MKVIGFISREDPFHNKVAWSGTKYKLRESIELAGFDVRWIPFGNSLAEKLLTFLLNVWNHTIGKRHQWLIDIHFRPIAKLRATELDANPIVKECDFLFFPGGAQVSLFCKVKKPVIYLTDSTAIAMIDYYWFNISQKSKAMAIEMDKEAFRQSAICILSSQWALESVVKDYHCEKNKCYVLEFGPNIDTNDIRKSQPYTGGQLTLLFSGKDWIRKGGEIAVEVVEILREKGIDAKLIVAGPLKCPYSCEGKSYIEFAGYLDKNKLEDYETYLKLFEKSHIFLLPTKAECSAIVYSEAAAAGLPCYTYLTGGVGNYLVNELSGQTLPLGSSASEFAEQIMKDIQKGNLLKYQQGALRIYEERQNWTIWAKEFGELVRAHSLIYW